MDLILKVSFIQITALNNWNKRTILNPNFLFTVILKFIRLEKVGINFKILKNPCESLNSTIGDFFQERIAEFCTDFWILSEKLLKDLFKKQNEITYLYYFILNS